MFDHNKLDEYKEWMDKNNITSLVFGDREWRFGEDSEFFYLDICNDYTLEFEAVIETEDWEDFKKEVANYFLNK